MAMFKSLAIGTCLALGLSACATTPPAQSATTAQAATPPAGCVSQTATRLPVKNSECAGFGNTYSQDDIRNTGQIDLSRALKTLDPSIH
jgi:hypothetical protein